MSPMPRNEIEPLMTVEELAGYLNIAEKTIRNRVSAGSIPFVKVGSALRFRRSAIDGWITDQTNAAEEGRAA